jgi:phospholipase C
LKALAASPDVWKKTVFIINYDENDGFFDHVPPPLPPLPTMADAGKVSDGIEISENGFNSEHATKLAQDLVTAKYARFPAAPRDQLTMGLGSRVPCLIISPWTVGGRVCSELFDHTSTLRFLDTWLAARGLQKEGTTFENISSWRQAICGDMTSAFDFTRKLDTVAGQGKSKLDAAVAAVKPVPAYLTKADQTALVKALPQYKGSATDIAADHARETRLKQDRMQVELLPLGYDFNVYGSIAKVDGTDKFNLSFSNRGMIGVALTVYSYHEYDKDRGAWFYALEKTETGKPVIIADSYDLAARGGKYELAVHAPNGYLSEFKGDASIAGQLLIADIVEVKSVDGGKQVRFDFAKWPSANGDLAMINAYTGETSTIAAGTAFITAATKDGWYDVSFIDKAGTGYLRRYAGHIENGLIGKTDPAIGKKYDLEKRIYEAAII